MHSMVFLLIWCFNSTSIKSLSLYYSCTNSCVLSSHSQLTSTSSFPGFPGQRSVHPKQEPYTTTVWIVLDSSSTPDRGISIYPRPRMPKKRHFPAFSRRHRHQAILNHFLNMHENISLPQACSMILEPMPVAYIVTSIFAASTHGLLIDSKDPRPLHHSLELSSPYSLGDALTSGQSIRLLDHQHQNPIINLLSQLMRNSPQVL